MNLTDIMLVKKDVSGKKQTQKGTHCMIPFIFFTLWNTSKTSLWWLSSEKWRKFEIEPEQWLHMYIRAEIHHMIGTCMCMCAVYQPNNQDDRRDQTKVDRFTFDRSWDTFSNLVRRKISWVQILVVLSVWWQKNEGALASGFYFLSLRIWSQ